MVNDMMTQLGYSLKQISKDEDQNYITTVKSSGNIQVHLCQFSLTQDYKENLQLNIERSPSKSFSKNINAATTFFKLNLPLIDELMKRQLAKTDQEIKVIFFEEIYKNIINQITLIEYQLKINLKIQTNYQDNFIEILVIYDGSTILNLNLSLKSHLSNIDSNYFFYELMIYYSNGDYQENMIRFSAFNNTYELNLKPYLEFEDLLGSQKEIINEFLDQFPSVFQPKIFYYDKQKVPFYYSQFDFFNTLNVDGQYFAVILKLGNESKISSHTIQVFKMANPNLMFFKENPVFERTFFRVRKNVLIDLIKREDWESHLQTLGF